MRVAPPELTPGVVSLATPAPILPPKVTPPVCPARFSAFISREASPALVPVPMFTGNFG